MSRRAGRGPIAVWLTVVALLLQLAACSAPTAPQPSTPAAATLDDTPPQAAGRQASLVSRTHVDGRMWDIVVRSPALRSEVTVRLLLPQRYADEPARRWPVLYLFHGCCDNYLSWTRSTDIEQLSEPWNLLVAMPDGGQVGFYSNWRTGPAWEAFHTRELPLLLAAQYRGSKLQAVGGVSMGGLGALGYAARQSGQYAAAVSISGIVHTLLSDDVSRNYLGLLQSFNHDPLALWGHPSWNRDVWQLHNPYDLAPRLRGVDLFISAGNGDPGPLDAVDATSDPIETSIGRQNHALAARLRDLRLPARINLYGPGTHNWVYWQRELHLAWPLITHALGAGVSDDRT